MQSTMRSTLSAAALALTLLAAPASWAQTDAALAAAAKEASASVTKSGLVYRSLKDGTGASPKASDQVMVHYKGTESIRQ